MILPFLCRSATAFVFHRKFRRSHCHRCFILCFSQNNNRWPSSKTYKNHSFRGKHVLLKAPILSSKCETLEEIWGQTHEKTNENTGFWWESWRLWQAHRRAFCNDSIACCHAQTNVAKTYKRISKWLSTYHLTDVTWPLLVGGMGSLSSIAIQFPSLESMPYTQFVELNSSTTFQPKRFVAIAGMLRSNVVQFGKTCLRRTLILS